MLRAPVTAQLQLWPSLVAGQTCFPAHCRLGQQLRSNRARARSSLAEAVRDRCHKAETFPKKDRLFRFQYVIERFPLPPIAFTYLLPQIQRLIIRDNAEVQAARHLCSNRDLPSLFQRNKSVDPGGENFQG